MGTKLIWDGVDLPAEGDMVLIHLASCDAWVKHRVTHYRIEKTDSKYEHRIFIHVAESDDPRSGTNARLLCDVRPVDFREKLNNEH